MRGVETWGDRTLEADWVQFQGKLTFPTSPVTPLSLSGRHPGRTANAMQGLFEFGKDETLQKMGLNEGGTLRGDMWLMVVLK